MDDDGDDKDDTKRRTRNLSEKKRRDQFNTLVNELSTMVSTNNRKMDKSTVLKATISFLKNHNDITVRSRAHDVHEDWKPAFLSNEEFTYLVLEALEGFLIVFSSTGRVHYVSDSVTSLLGHNPTDIVNQSIFDFTHEDDRPHLYGLLQSMDPTQLGRSKESEIRFHCHLKRGTLDFRDKTTYELIQFYGHFRSSADQGCNEENYKQDMNESSLLFVCTGRLSTPHLIRDVSLVDFSRNEFTSRHSLEWKFLFLDHRAPPIIGYLPFEVLGTSGYDYYHFDDLEKVVTCHEALMQKGELTSCYYRFLTKGQQWIWLQSRFYITYHQWSSKPEFVVCTHRVVSYADVTNNMKTESGEGEESSHMSEADTCQSLVAPTTSEPVASTSPSGMSETCDAFVQYRRASQTASVKSASASSTSATVDTIATSSSHWARARMPPQPGSDTGSHSGDERYSQRAFSHRDRDREANQGSVHTQYSSVRAGSDSGDERSSQRNSSRETHKEDEATLVPQHGIGAQFLNPAPYVSAVSAVGVGSMVPLPVQTVPVIVSPNSAQMQEQLQRKHEELQQMIVRQQAELRQVKEQLLLARLGILPPLINTQYVNPEDSQVQQMQHVPAQIVYEPQPPRPVITEYPPPHPPHPHMPQ